MIAVVAAAMLAAGSVGRSRPAAHRRLGVVLRAESRTETEREPAAESATELSERRLPPARRLAVAAVVLVAGVAVIGGLFGVVVGVAAAGFVAIMRVGPTAPRVDPDDVPVVVDLVAGCLAAGASLADALDAASVAADDVLREACRSVASALRAGAPADEAWRAWLADPWLAPVARTAVRTSASGAAAAADLRRTSTRLRARRRAAAQHRVRQASVWLVAPLGLCFLPAFVLVAVVPLVIGLLPSLR
jgi:pilus assembly protein TadC